MLNITAHGHLGRDPELKTIGDDQVARFSIGCNTSKEETTWVNCTVWGRRSDVVMRFLTKGAAVTIAGRGKLSTYTKKDGTQGTTLEVSVSDFTLPPREDKEPF